MLYRKRTDDQDSRRATHDGALRLARCSTRLANSSALMLCACAFVITTNASAANWEFAPRVEAGYRYNDNYRLEMPGGEVEVSGAEVDVDLTLRTVDPRTRFELSPRVRSTYFPDESDQDSNDYFLRTLLEDTTPRRRMGFRADYEQEDVVRSELLTAEVDSGLGEPELGDSGLSLQRNRRDLIRFVPYFAYDITQRAGLELRARYVDAQYERELQNFHQDFSEAAVSAGLSFQVSARSDLIVRAIGSRYETTFTSDAQAAELEWRTDFSPNSTLYLRAGAQNTEDRSGEKESSVLAGIGGRWASQRNRLFLDLTRTVGPASAGTILERHQLRMRLNHDISQRLSWVIGARAFRDEALEESSTYDTREYAAADAGFEWRVQRSWALTATYSYFWQEYEDDPSDASANAFLIGIVYEPKRAD